MDKRKYDFSIHVNVPDEWVEKALAIPAGYEKKRRTSVVTSRRIAAAAGLVLVLGLSLTIYFLFGNKTVVPSVLPSPTSSESAAVPTEYSQEPAPEDHTTATGTPTESPAQAPVQRTEPHEDDPNTAETYTAVISTEPTTLAPTAEPTNAPEAPTALPTQAPVEPTISPTEYPIQPTTDAPKPPDDNIGAETAPSEAAYSDDEEYIVICVPLCGYAAEKGYSSTAGEQNVYCRLCDSEGRQVIPGDPYDEAHEARLYYSSGIIYLFYSCIAPAEYSAEPRVFNYKFYTADGSILTSDSILAY